MAYNLPPGVTDRMIEEAQSFEDEEVVVDEREGDSPEDPNESDWEDQEWDSEYERLSNRELR